MKLVNLDVTIERGVAPKYTVAVRTERRGRFVDEARIDLAEPELSRLLDGVRERTASKEDLEDLGRKLYASLLATGTGDANNLFQRGLAEASFAEDGGARIRLSFMPPELASVPWEFLYNSLDREFFATQVESCVVRLLENAPTRPVLRAELPLHVLCVAPNVPGIDIAGERRTLEEVTARLGPLVTLTWVPEPVTLAAIERCFADGPPAAPGAEFRVVHFLGHGAFRDQTGWLQLQAEDGTPFPVEDTTFAELLSNQRGLRLVVLNACQTAPSGLLPGYAPRQGLVGTAPLLVERGIPAVIAMQTDIRNDDAKDFAERFYRALLSGADRGRVDLAVTRARSGLRERGVAMGTPVLYLQSQDGTLFDVDGPAPTLVERLNPAPELDRLTALDAAGRAFLAPSDAAVRGFEAPAAAPEERAHTEAQLQRWARQRWALRAPIAAAVAVMAGMIVGIWTGAFDVVTSWTNAATIAAWSVGADEHPSEPIVGVTLGWSPGVSAYQPVEARPRLGALMRTLAEAGARLVALDLVFERAAVNTVPEADRDAAAGVDQGLVDAVRRAERSGTRVALTFGNVDGAGQPVVLPPLREAASILAWECEPDRVDTAYPVYTAALGVTGPMPDTLWPSLAAAIWLSDVGHARANAIPVRDLLPAVAWGLDGADATPTLFKRVDRFPKDDCTARVQASAIPRAALLVGSSSPEPAPLADDAVRAMSPEARHAAFAGRVVVIRSMTTENRVHTQGFGGSRSTSEARRDLLSALKHGAFVRLPDTLRLTLSVVFLGASAAAVALWPRVRREWARPGALLSIFLAYSAFSFALFRARHLLFDLGDGALILLLTYGAAVLTRKGLLR